MIMRGRQSACLYLIIIVSCGVLWILYMKITDTRVPEPFNSYSDKNEVWYQDWHDRFKKGRKIILLYTTWFDHREWVDYSGRRLYERMEQCDKAKNCLLTYDKSWLSKAVAVAFHGRDVEENRNRYYSAERLHKIREKVPLAQKWIFFSHENPQKEIRVYKPYDGLFNWTATFSRKSDIFAPYLDYVPRMDPGKWQRNYAKEKTGLVAWAVSNCKSRLRLDYVLQLQKYINVTVYGRCSCYFNNRRHCSHANKACKEEVSKYKFYLAFENDFCHDYVTEKYWERLEQDSVPVVMGSNYDMLAVSGSYINADDFKSIKELAEYLLYLDKNDNEYNKYFTYKANFTGGRPLLFCRICEKLNSVESMRQSQVALSKVYNYERSCGTNKAKAEKFQQQIDASRKDDSALTAVLKNSLCWLYRVVH